MSATMNNRDLVRRQYEREDNLELRRSIWHPDRDGRDPATEALAAVIAESPGRVLEVGAGTAAFAARLRVALPEADLVVTDQSERFVDLARERGLTSKVADVQRLPFADASFDVVCAMWMLYHVPDLHQGLAELARVLRPGGLIVAATNGDEHVADLRRAAGGDAVVTQFSRENGEQALAAHFCDVHRQDYATRAIFADHEQALAYLASSTEEVPWNLPFFAGSREYAGAGSVFTARKAQGPH